MNTVREMIESSTIFRGVIAVIVVSTSSYAVLSGVELPDWWTVVAGTVIGFYFAGALANQQSKAMVRAYEQGQQHT